MLKTCEPERWTVVFHRHAENWFFSLIAFGQFKHVSAFSWVPSLKVWVVYDLGFRRTRIVILPDTAESKAHLGQVIKGNAMVTLMARHNAVPVFRLGLFCTTAIKHLLGITGGALRPDALFRLLLAEGGELSDDASQENRSASRPEPRDGAGAGITVDDHAASSAGAG